MTCQIFEHVILQVLPLDNHADYGYLFDLRLNHSRLKSPQIYHDYLHQFRVQLLLANQFHHHSSSQAPRSKILFHLIQLALVQFSLRLAKLGDRYPHTFDLVVLRVSIR